MVLDRFFQPRLAELGKIKCGGKEAKIRTTQSGQTWRAPEKHDYFTITTLHRNGQGDLIPDDALMAELLKEFGSPDKRLRQLPIRVLSNNPDDIMQAAYVWYEGKKVAARSDGETVTWYKDAKTQRVLPEPKAEPWKPEMLELTRPGKKPTDTPIKLFKTHTTFNCSIASKEAKFGGVYKFRTTSVITANQLYSTLVASKALAGGVLMGMPLWLVIRPIEVHPGEVTTTVYVVHVELRGHDMQAVRHEALEQMKYEVEFKTQIELMQCQVRKMLKAPGEGETVVEQADVNEEFQPDTAVSGIETDKAPEEQDKLLAEATAAETVDTTTGEVIDAEVLPPEVKAAEILPPEGAMPIEPLPKGRVTIKQLASLERAHKSLVWDSDDEWPNMIRKFGAESGCVEDLSEKQADLLLKECRRIYQETKD